MSAAVSSFFVAAWCGVWGLGFPGQAGRPERFRRVLTVNRSDRFDGTTHGGSTVIPGTRSTCRVQSNRVPGFPPGAWRTTRRFCWCGQGCVQNISGTLLQRPVLVSMSK